MLLIPKRSCGKPAYSFYVHCFRCLGIFNRALCLDKYGNMGLESGNQERPCRANGKIHSQIDVDWWVAIGLEILRVMKRLGRRGMRIYGRSPKFGWFCFLVFS